jgi:hypothetical protein
MVGVIARFRLSGRHVADRFEEAAVVEPVDPFEGSELDRLKALPWAKAVDDLGLVEAVDGLREGVVITVSDAADGGIDAGPDQTLSIVNGNVLLGFNRSSRRSCGPIAGTRQRPRLVSSSRGSCAAGC